MSKRFFFVCIFAAVSIGLFLRTWNLTNHGFSHYDEAHYMMEVKFWLSLVDHRSELLAAYRAGTLNASTVELLIDGLPPNFTPKPLHGFFIAICSMITGIRAEWVGSLWSAIVGTLTIGLAALWVNRWFGSTAAILTAFFLAVSRSHIMYSRSQFAEADAIFFLMAAFFLHTDIALSRRRDRPEPSAPDGFWKLFLTGIVYGVAVGVNYRCLLVFPLIFAWDIWVSRFSIRKMGLIVAGMLTVLVMIELPYQIYILQGGTLPAGMKTYFGGFWARLFQDLPADSTRAKTFFTPHAGLFQTYLYLDNWAWFGGFLAGTFVVMISKCPVGRLVGILAWAPILIFSLVARGDGPRAVMTSIPFFVILSALGWQTLMKVREGLPAWMTTTRISVVVVSLLVASGAVRAWPETQVRSAWPETGKWLREQGQTVYTTFPLAVRFYLRKDQAILVPKESAETLPPGLWVIDRYNAEYAYPYDSVKRVTSATSPEKTFEGKIYPLTGLFFDWGVFVKKGNWREEIRRTEMGNIDVYRVEAAQGRP